MVSKDGCGWFLPLAREGVKGNWDAVFAHDQHPLFPILIVGARRIIDDEFLAGKCVSLVFGTIAAVPFFLLMRDIFGASTGLWAGWIFMCQPMLVEFSGDVVSESLYLCMLLWAVYFGHRVLRHGRLASSVGVGVFSAAAYWTRPEGAGVMMVFCPLAVLCAVVRVLRGADRVKELKACGTAVVLSVLSWGIVACPFLLDTWRRTGRLTLTKKKSLMRMVSRKQIQAEAQDQLRKEAREAARRAASKGDKRLAPPPAKKSMTQAQAVLHKVRVSITFATRKGVRTLHAVFLLCTVVGICTWRRRRAGRRLFEWELAAYGGAYLAVGFLLLLAHSYLSKRHLMFPSIMCLGWAGYGLPVIGDAIGRMCRISRADTRAHFCRCVALIIALLMAIEPSQPRTWKKIGRKEIGLWVRENLPADAGIFWAELPRAACYAGRQVTPVYADVLLRDVVKQARDQGAQYLVTRHSVWKARQSDYEEDIRKLEISIVHEHANSPKDKEKDLVIFHISTDTP